MDSLMLSSRHSERDRMMYEWLVQTFQASPLPLFDKLEAFPRFITKRSLARLLCKHEIFQKIVPVNGYIIECGVLNGAGLFAWGHFTNIYEPSNYNRKIIGFDTFAGFPHIAPADQNVDKNPEVGDLHGDSLDHLLASVERYNLERHLAHLPNIELVAGDFCETGPAWLAKNKHALVSLLYLDFDLYEPTKLALELFLPRMGKGAIICFDELMCANYPGETVALLETLCLEKYQIQRFPIEPWISYIQL